MANKRVYELSTITNVLCSDYIVIDRPAGTANAQLSSIAAYITSLPVNATVIDNSVDTNKLVDNSVTTNKINDRSVTTQKIALNAVTNDELANNSVNTSNITDGSITAAKLSATVVNPNGGISLDSTLGLSVKTTIRPEYITNTVLSLDDANCIVPVNNTSAITITVPSDTTANFPIGTNIVIYQKGTGQVTITGAVGVTVLSNSSKRKTTGQYSSVALFKLASNSWLLGGDLTA